MSFFSQGAKAADFCLRVGELYASLGSEFEILLYRDIAYCVRDGRFHNISSLIEVWHQSRDKDMLNLPADAGAL